MLVVWSGAEWRVIHPLIDAGRMPHLQSIVEQGVMAELATVQPQVAPLLAASLASGRLGDKHGVLSYFDAVDGRLRPVTVSDMASPPMWETLGQAGLRTIVTGWPAYPAEIGPGVFVSQFFTRFGAGGRHALHARLPRVVRPAALAERLVPLRVEPPELSLEELRHFVPRPDRIHQGRDPSLAKLATWLAESTSNHAMTTSLLDSDVWDFACVWEDLIDRASHAFMQFHPPRRACVSFEQFETYQNVVAATYHFADMMLGRLLELAGPQATVLVVSDHGFRCEKDRPLTSGIGRGAADWHRQLGILAMRGPDVRRDEWIWGPTLLDVAPTVLASFGIAPGDSDGRAIERAWQRMPTVDRAAPTPLPRNSDTLIDDEVQALCEYYVGEGFVEPFAVHDPQATKQARDARDFNLSYVLQSRGALVPAIELLEALVERRPGVARFALQLANYRIALGETDAARELIDTAIRQGLPLPMAQRVLGQAFSAQGNHAAALELLFASEQSHPVQLGIHAQIGEVYISLERWDEAERAFKKELQQDAACALAYFGLGRVAMARELYEDATESLLESITLWHAQPAAHRTLGFALQELGRVDEAMHAFERSLQLDPRQTELRRHLAALRAAD